MAIRCDTARVSAARGVLSRRVRTGLRAASVCGLLLAGMWLTPTSAQGTVMPPGFSDTTVVSGLTFPTAVRFAPDGRIFVAEKQGLIKVFDNLADTTPSTYADLRTKVYNASDRGLLGIALDPDFATQPYVYALYTYDAPIGGIAPVWRDACPSPPGPTLNGCVASARLSRLSVPPKGGLAQEAVLINDWCQQYMSHSIGTIEFGPDGALYAGAGDAASFSFIDYGQKGDPPNPCGDPPVPTGGTQTLPTAEGGSFRSQDLRTTSDPVTLDGSLIRVDPATGAALSTNPLFGRSDANARRIVAYGFRNPFRFTFRPGTNEVWVGDVGGGPWEEIDRIVSPTDSNVENFGWPCYDGPGHNKSFEALGTNICTNLYAQTSAATTPYFAYNHTQKVVAGETCPTGSSAISGLAFTAVSHYPPPYGGALYFADYARNCIWVMPTGANGLPDTTNVKTFAAQAATPVDLEIGPGGDLFYVDFGGGTIHRIQHTAGNQPPRRRCDREPNERAAPPHSHLRRQELVRPRRGRHDLVRLGSGRRRLIRRLGDALTHVHVHAQRERHFSVEGHRFPRSIEHRYRDDLAGRHRTPGLHLRPTFHDDLEGRRRHFLQRCCQRPGGRLAARVVICLDSSHPPLSVELPHTRAPDVLGRQERHLHRAGPRVSIGHRRSAHGDGLPRSKRHDIGGDRS